MSSKARQCAAKGSKATSLKFEVLKKFKIFEFLLYVLTLPEIIDQTFIVMSRSTYCGDFQRRFVLNNLSSTMLLLPMSMPTGFSNNYVD